jgi:hypothetical protein
VVSNAERKHIFISYAWEDEKFALWLAKTLTREGFFVWIDKMKLLGGEPFPSEIEDAISNRTHQFLALMSHSSLKKPSPRRERMLADKAAKKLNLSDFIIPLMVDDLSPNDLDFLTTELTALPFNGNWNQGLKLLIKKLVQTDAPRDPEGGRQRLKQWYESRTECTGPGESAITNLVEIQEIPKKIFCFTLGKSVRLEPLKKKWSYYKSDKGFWSFTPPPGLSARQFRQVRAVEWRKTANALDIIPRNVVVALINKQIQISLARKGLLVDPDTERLRFKPGQLPKNRIQYVNLSGRKTRVDVTGERISHYRDGDPVKFRYYLQPDLRVHLDRFDIPLLSISVRVAVSDLNGKPFPAKTALLKRKKATRGWLNQQWLNRTVGVLAWFTGGKPTTLLKTDTGNLVIDYSLLKLNTDIGINEEKIGEQKFVEPFDDLEAEVEA